MRLSHLARYALDGTHVLIFSSTNPQEEQFIVMHKLELIIQFTQTYQRMHEVMELKKPLEKMPCHNFSTRTGDNMINSF